MGSGMSIDNLDRLSSATHPLTFTQTFSYDPVGNRLTNASQHNAGNQLTEDAGFTYTYDANGNLTRKTIKANGNHTDYTYDAENRLTKVEEFAAGATVPAATSTYRYDGLGRRIEKVGNGLTRRYIYDGEDILLEYDETNTLLARNTHGPGIDEPIAMTRGGSTYFYHADGLGTVTDLTDSTGATAKSYSYDAWGNQVETTGTIESPYTYTGREFDSDTGLYYYRARYYDARIGRFLGEDPLGLKDGANLYLYVGANPLKWRDPSGRTRLELDIKNGTLTIDPEKPGVSPYAIPVTSGRPGPCLNNPSCVRQENIGPIPPGDYTILTELIDNPGSAGDILRYFSGLDYGDWRVPIHPNRPAEVWPRFGFKLHGGRIPGSAGCIDVGGGVFGNATTDRLLNDLLADSDGIVPLKVK